MANTFGKYQLIEKIGEGGMAEVYLAKQMGDLAGFEKRVALKTIYPHLTEREDLVVMFLDEARIAAQLNHPNIVQIYDLGKVDDTLYIAMEYIHGQDLRRICEKGIDEDNFLPREFAARIIADAAAGLHYAHTSTDEQGRPRNIVHRDVSPQNILVSMEGQVKMVDFGVAKAEDRLGHTQAGQRKGKLSYMSPEQLESKNVDARSDVYTLGIVLYETTVGKRLFRGRSDFETMNLVANAKVTPPSEVRPDFPAELEAIILKALQKEREDRYQSAQELQMALEDWLHAQDRRVGRVELGEYMRGLFSEGVGVSAVDAPAEDVGVPTSPMNDVGEVGAEGGHGHGAGHGNGAGHGHGRGVGGPPPSRRPAPQPQPDPAADAQADGGWEVDENEFGDYGDFSNKKTKLYAGLGALAAVATIAIVAWAMLNTEKDLATDEEKAYAAAMEKMGDAGVEVPDPPAMVGVDLATEPAGAAVVVNGLLAEAKTPGTFDLVADRPNEVVFYHPQYPPKRIVVGGDADEAPEKVVFEPYDKEPKTGTLTIHSDPGAGIVYINGERLGAAPQTVEDLPAGIDHHVEVRKSGHWSFAGFFGVVPGENNAFQVKLAPEDSAGRKQYVEVTYDAIPRDTAVTIDGELKGGSRVAVNQIRNQHVHVELAKPNHRTQDRYLLLRDVGTFTYRTFLEPISREKGTLTVSVEPEGSTIYIGSNSYDSNPVKGLDLLEGKHTVVFELPDGSRRETKVEVYPKMKNVYELTATDGGVDVKRVD
ncbi:PEGA domain-containing protein [Persicimonas caeni]|uniref:PEGA domain-containing protein n=1 Tax=Persicimonas caeni TaxID=2292766 RepID=A0A4Y6PYV1_PERCE|nr:serine/threonine-protein kinase [Persicimonas caeni]QDG53339.1 PEGA domain-containing protein [Persicimonas caeni]QED34560.1 protein kinase [Persicimonas caeni]